MTLGLLAHAAEGKHIAHAVLQAKTGATVASAQADASGRIRFTNVAPGDYRLVLTNADGRSVTLSDLDGDGHDDIVIEGTKAPMDGVSKEAGAPMPAGSGKVSVSSFNVMKAAPAAAPVTAPRDSASGMATGRRMHKPYCLLMDWDGSIKGGFASESSAQMEGQRLPDNASGRCAVKVAVDETPGTIEVQSFSWGVQNKTGHVTLMK
jgi:hypothetical protein